MHNSSQNAFSSSIDIPEKYIQLLNAHLKLRKYFGKGFSHLNDEFKVKNSTQLKISIEGNEEALSAVKFINSFDGEDDNDG